MGCIKTIFLSILMALSASSFAQDNDLCETAIFNSGNLKNDSTKMKIISRVTADTTVCSLSGNVIDRNSQKPVVDVTLLIVNEKGQNVGLARTDKAGKFRIDVFGFTEKLGSLIVKAPRHKCLTVMYFQFKKAGGDMIQTQIILQAK